MFGKRAASILSLGLFASSLFAQGLQTRATKDDWEEINFEFNSSILTDGFPTLLWLADFLHTNPGYRMTVTGNTDYVGDVPYNERLALARASVVRELMV